MLDFFRARLVACHKKKAAFHKKEHARLVACHGNILTPCRNFERRAKAHHKNSAARLVCTHVKLGGRQLFFSWQAQAHPKINYLYKRISAFNQASSLAILCGWICAPTSFKHIQAYNCKIMTITKARSPATQGYNLRRLKHAARGTQIRCGLL